MRCFGPGRDTLSTWNLTQKPLDGWPGPAYCMGLCLSHPATASSKERWQDGGTGGEPRPPALHHSLRPPSFSQKSYENSVQDEAGT